MKKNHIVYVYGSLRPGNGEKYSISGKMYSLGGFPAVLKVSPPEEASTVVCERIEVTDRELERLDNYEGYDKERPETSLFIRSKLLDGWIYYYNGDLDEKGRIVGGDWLTHKGQQRGHAFDYFLDETSLDNTITEGVKVDRVMAAEGVW